MALPNLIPPLASNALAANPALSAPIWILAIAAVAYIARNWFEAALKSRFAVAESQIAASLAVKQGLRAHEQDELVDFRIAIEKWEYFLQSGVGDLTLLPDSQAFDPTGFYKSDHDLFGEVRLAAVKASIFLRDAALEVELLKTINAIRQLYYPLIHAALDEIVDLQGRLAPFRSRLKQFEASGQKDAAIMLNAEEAQLYIGMQHRLTEVTREFSEGLSAQYRPIGEQLHDLKARINVHIYRPLTRHEIDRRDG